MDIPEQPVPTDPPLATSADVDAQPYNTENYRLGDSVGYLVKRVRMVFTSAVDREMAAYDVSYDQWGILLTMAKGKGDTAAELSREMCTDTGSMTRMIDRLEAKGMVKRTRSEDDRRIVRLALTEAGQALADQLPAVMVRVLNRHLVGFSQPDVEQLKNFLRRILENAANETDPID
jgi:DNA-binding MarR family transcriptional regulator